MPNGGSLAQLHQSFDPDTDRRGIFAWRVEVEQNDMELPVHQHRKGQLVLALKGGVTCKVPQGMWMVPPQHAVWIPGGMPHSNHATDNARIGFVFIEPDIGEMPAQCCTLFISPVVRELILYLADEAVEYPEEGPVARMAAVLTEQLSLAPVEHLHLPISEHPKIRQIANSLTLDPANRNTLPEWARQLAISERSLARLIHKETGLSFGRWRQQFHLIIALRDLAAGVPVQEVAWALGYDSVTAFITMFKKALGRPPAQYFAALA